MPVHLEASKKPFPDFGFVGLVVSPAGPSLPAGFHLHFEANHGRIYIAV
jgi:hypothetical protein